jgi:hypothetical protein
MPRLAAHVYAAHQASVLKLLTKSKEGLSKGEMADALNISASTVATIIKKAGLVEAGKKGKSDLYTAPSNGDAPELETPETVELPPEVKAAAVANSPEAINDDEPNLALISRLDEELVDTRNALKDAAAKMGKAAGEWAAHQALVDALQERMTKLATQRMNACS